MNDEEIAAALVRDILGGEPFNYPCGCFGVIVEVYKWNANWVRVQRLVSCDWVRRLCETPIRRGPARHGTPATCVQQWRTRDGDFITQEEWNKHTKMSEYVYGRERSGHRSGT